VEQRRDGRDDDRPRPVQEEGGRADDDEVQESEDGARPARGVDEQADEGEVAQDLDVRLDDLGLDQPPDGPVEQRQGEGERRQPVEVGDLDLGARAELDEDRGQDDQEEDDDADRRQPEERAPEPKFARNPFGSRLTIPDSCTPA
jgi:hypothetical protein